MEIKKDFYSFGKNSRKLCFLNVLNESEYINTNYHVIKNI